MCEAIWSISCDLLTTGSKGKILAWLFAVLSSKPRGVWRTPWESSRRVLLLCLWGWDKRTIVWTTPCRVSEFSKALGRLDGGRLSWESFLGAGVVYHISRSSDASNQYCFFSLRFPFRVAGYTWFLLVVSTTHAPSSFGLFDLLPSEQHYADYAGLGQTMPSYTSVFLFSCVYLTCSAQSPLISSVRRLNYPD